MSMSLPFSMPDVRGVIVDLDGTMVDTLGDFEAALNRMLAELDLPPVTRALVERTVGRGSEHLIRAVLEHQLALPQVDALMEPAWRIYQRHYLDINGAFSTVYPGVLAGLQQWQASGLQLACLTNKPLNFALPLLKAKGLDVFFTQVFGGDSFERKKPDPLPLHKTCEALGTLAAQTLMIGDSENDGLAARAAGCPVVLVSYGYNHGRPIREVDADGYVDSLDQLAFATL
ncbi:MAG: phosphoglycolate phosphatase [Rhodoferax sp.]|nr:phosphoglycolate phosphatase [Rhodoferax sp.]